MVEWVSFSRYTISTGYLISKGLDPHTFYRVVETKSATTRFVELYIVKNDFGDEVSMPTRAAGEIITTLSALPTQEEVETYAMLGYTLCIHG